jgi:hypothetical protein
MRKRSSIAGPPARTDEAAFFGVQSVAGGGKNPAAVALGRLGGRKGGLARAQKLSAARRKRIAQMAARARWSREGE